jgi:hypothetical protein
LRRLDSGHLLAHRAHVLVRIGPRLVAGRIARLRVLLVLRAGCRVVLRAHR